MRRNVSSEMRFVQDQKTQDWDAEVTFRGATIHLTIDRVHPVTKHEALAASALKRVEEAWPSVEDSLLRHLHPLYNREWADPERGFPPFGAKEFLSQIRLESIDLLDEEGALSLFFDDSGMFAGHCIHIFWNSDGKMYDAGLEG